jgi:hypothetical protein
MRGERIMRNPRVCNPVGNSPHTVFNKKDLVAAEGRAMNSGKSITGEAIGGAFCGKSLNTYSLVQPYVS